MESFQDYLLESKQIEKKLDVSEYYTNDLIDEINKFDRDAVISRAKNFEMK